MCHGQDSPGSNAWYVVNDHAGTESLRLASGHTTPFLTQPGHIYWIQTQINGEFVDWGPYDAGHHYNYWIAGDGSPITRRVFDGDPSTNTPNPAWYTDNTGPVAGVGVPAIVFEYTLPTRHPWPWGWWRW